MPARTRVRLSRRALLRAVAIVAALAATMAPASARAGRRAFLFAWDTEVLAAGDVELEQWLWAKVRNPPTDADVGWLWFSPVVGLSPRVEVAFPWEVVAPRKGAGARLTNFTGEVRLSLTDPNGDGPVRVLVRALAQANLQHPLAAEVGQAPFAGGDLVVSFGDPRGSHAVVNVGALADVDFEDDLLLVQTAAAGYALAVTEDLRVSVEYFHEMFPSDVPRDADPAMLAGPGVSWSRGAVWLTAGALFGLSDAAPAAMPRMQLAVLF